MTSGSGSTGQTPEGTGSQPPASRPEPDAATEPTASHPPDPAPATLPDADRRSAGPPGSGTFTIEGRAAPGLFVVGWLASILGIGAILVGGLATDLARLVLVSLGLALLSAGLVAGAGSQALERRARGVAGYAGPSPFLVFAATIPLVFLLGVGLGLVFDLADVPSDGPLGLLAGSLATAAAYFLVVGLAVVGTGSLSWDEIGMRLPSRAVIGDVLRAVTLAVPIVFVTAILAAILTSFLPVPQSPLPQPTDATGWLVNAVVAVVVAPVSEEMLFRGFATTAWARRLGHVRAIMRGGLFFAFVHVLTGITGDSFLPAAQAAFVAFAIRIPIGLALGWVFLRFRSLWPSVALHAAYNGVTLLFAFAAQ